METMKHQTNLEKVPAMKANVMSNLCRSQKSAFKKIAKTTANSQPSHTIWTCTKDQEPEELQHRPHLNHADWLANSLFLLDDDVAVKMFEYSD